MGLFSKKDEVPKILSTPTLPELPKPEQLEKKDLPGLPSFPTTPNNENFNREMVKSAVSDMPSPGEDEVNMGDQESLHIREEPEEEHTIPPRPSAESPIPEPPTIPSITDAPRKTLELTASMGGKPVTKQAEPIFVRIDKFQSSQKNFEDIKNKVKEIELVLKKIKDVKSHEEIELKGWTEDIEKIKSRLTEIDDNIFNQI